MTRAIEARGYWETHTLFKPYYHHTGRLVVYPPEQEVTLAQINDTRSNLGLHQRQIRNASVQALSADSICIPTTFKSVYNEDDGTVQWDDALQAFKQHCASRNMNFALLT